MKNKIIYIAIIMVISFFYYHTISSRQYINKKISFTGDVIMHGPVKSFAYRNNIIDPITKRSTNNRGFDIIFEKIKPEFELSHYVVANMEFPISYPYDSKAFIFNCHPEVLDSFKHININIVNIANNHILDQGFIGFLETLEELEQRNILYVGAGKISTNTINDINGIIIGEDITIGIIAYTGVFNYYLSRKNKQEAFINDFYDEKKVMDDIAAIRKKSDFLIMTAHFGEEYSTQPSERDRQLIRTYLEAGVDCFIGHHPHVIQPVEQFISKDGRTCTVFYSLGNFVANQSSKHSDHQSGVECSTREGLVVHVVLEKQKRNDTVKHRYEVIPIIIRNIPDTESRMKYGRRIQPIAISRYRDEMQNVSANEEKRTVLKERLDAIHKHLFLYGNYGNIQYSGNY